MASLYHMIPDTNLTACNKWVCTAASDLSNSEGIEKIPALSTDCSYLENITIGVLSTLSDCKTTIIKIHFGYLESLKSVRGVS